jgi:RNA polymerase sigma-70 factor (ECF subfamily)
MNFHDARIRNPFARFDAETAPNFQIGHETRRIRAESGSSRRRAGLSSDAAIGKRGVAGSVPTRGGRLDVPLHASPEALLAQVEWVRRLARTLVAGEERAADVAQEAWLEVLQRPPAHGRNVRAWLAIVTRNVARKFVRSDSRRRRNEEAAGAHALASASSAPPNELPPAAAMVERAELQRRVVAAVLALEEPTRSTLLWRYFEDLAPGAIAAATGVPLATVKTRLKRGLAQLRARLREEFGIEGREWIAALAPLLSSPVGGGPTAMTAATNAGAAVGVGGVLVMANLKLLTAAIVVAGAGAAAWWIGSPPPPSPLDPVRAVASSPGSEPASASRVEPSNAERVGETVAPAGASASDRTAAATAGIAAPAIALSGTVRDERGAPVEGAEVFVGREQAGAFSSLASVFSQLAWSGGQLTGDPRSFQRAVTDAAGRFAIERLAPGFVWSIAAIHAELGSAWRSGVVVRTAAPPPSIDLVLEAGVVLFGRVTKPDGAACAKARVEIDAFPRGQPSRTGWGTSFGAVETDDEGRFRTLAVPGVAFELTASPPGPSRQRSSMPKRSGVLAVEEGRGEREVDLRLDPLVTVRGSMSVADGRPFGEAVRAAFDASELVRAEQTGFGVFAMTADPRVALGLRPPDDSQDVPAFTEIDGTLDVDAATYSIVLLDPGMTHVAVIARRKLLAWAPLGAGDGGQPSPNGPELVVDLSTLPAPIRGGTCAIRVVDAVTKAPVAHASLSWYSGVRDGNRTTWQNNLANTDASGVATLELPTGETSLEVHASGYASGSEFVRVRAGGREERVAELVRTARFVVGSVRLPSGGAASDARVFAYRATASGYAPVGAVSPCDSNGRFELRDMPAQDFVVVATCAGCAPGVARVASGRDEVDVALQGGVAFKIAVVARDERQVGLVRCRFVDADGIPVVDEFRAGSSVHQGSPRELRVVPGTYMIEVDALDYEPNVSTQRIDGDFEIEFGMHPIRR